MGDRPPAILIDGETLSRGVGRIAAEIDRDFGGQPVLLVGILKGCVFFLSDLARQIRGPVVIDFLRASSYGTGRTSSGSVQLGGELSIDPAGRNVVVVEDIVDTGRTLVKILEALRERRPSALKVCALLRKRIPENATVPVDYLGFEIEDRFVVGYGLDYAESFRNLPYVATLNDSQEDQ